MFGQSSQRSQQRTTPATPVISAFSLVAQLAVPVLLAGFSQSCKEGPDVKRYVVTFEVRADRAPLPGARLSVRGRLLAQTNAEGTAQLALPGTDGTTHQVTVACPAGTRSPAQPITVTLRTLELADHAAARRGIVQTVQCPPEERTLGVVVRTPGQNNIPVFWQGREIGRTDLGGVAHLTFRVRPQTPLQLELHTADNAQLRPENPRQTFLVADADDLQVWNQDFTVEPLPRARVVRRSAPRNNRPVQIRSNSVRTFFRR